MLQGVQDDKKAADASKNSDGDSQVSVVESSIGQLSTHVSAITLTCDAEWLHPVSRH